MHGGPGKLGFAGPSPRLRRRFPAPESQATGGRSHILGGTAMLDWLKKLPRGGELN